MIWCLVEDAIVMWVFVRYKWMDICQRVYRISFKIESCDVAKGEVGVNQGDGIFVLVRGRALLFCRGKGSCQRLREAEGYLFLSVRRMSKAKILDMVLK